MEEKILFDIQRFADTEITAGQSATIDGITYTATNGTVTISGNTISGDAEIKETVTNHTFKLGKATISVNGTKFSSTNGGTVTINGNAITLSGNISASKSLSEKNVTTSGNDTVNLLLAANDELTIDGSTYTAEDAAVISVKNGAVTSNSGTVTVKPNGSVTINGVSYSNPATNSTIKLDEGDATLNGKFTLTATDFVKINKINVKGDSVTFDSTDKNFTGDFQIKSSYGKNFKVNGVALTVDGETATAEVTNSLTKLTGSYTVGDGTTSLNNKNFTVSAGEISFQTLKDDSVKINDATFSGNKYFKLTAYFADNDVVKVDGTGIDITGNGKFILVNNTVAAKINGVDFTGTETYGQVDYLADGVKLNGAFTIGDGTQSLGNLTISNDSAIKGSTFKLGTNDSVKIGNVTYTGNGEISVDKDNETKIKLSGNISNITGITLSGKTFEVDENANVTFNVAKGDSVNIGGRIYSAQDDTGATVTVTFDENGTENYSTTGDLGVTGDTAQALTISKNKSATIAGVTVSAENDNATVAVDDVQKTVKVTSGDVKLDFTDEDVTDYRVNITQGNSAQIEGITFKQEEQSSGSNDIVFVSADEITLNTSMTVGDGTQSLNGKKFNTGKATKATFNLSSLGVSADGESADAISGDTIIINGVNYSGSGTVTVTNTGTEQSPSYKVALSGGDISVSGTFTNITSFELTGANTFTIGENAFKVGNNGMPYTLNMNTGSISSVSGINSGSTITEFGIGTFQAASAGTYVIKGIKFTTERSNVEFSDMMNTNVTVNGITYTGSKEVTVPSTGGIKVDNITYTTDSSGTVNDTTIDANVTGSFKLSDGVKLKGITYFGTGNDTGSVTSSGVTVDSISFTSDTSAIPTVTKNADGYTVQGVKFTVSSGKFNNINFSGNTDNITATSTSSLKIGDITYKGSGTLGINGNTITVSEGVTGEFDLSKGSTIGAINGITYSGTGTATITGSGVKIGSATYSLTSGTGTVNSDGSVSDGVTVKIAAGDSAKINGVTYVNNTGLALSNLTATSNGVTIENITYKGNGTVTVTTNEVTVSAGVEGLFNNISKVKEITFSSAVSGKITSDGITVDNVTYKGYGNVASDNTVTGANITGTFDLSKNLTIGGITYSGTGTGKITSDGVKANDIKFTSESSGTVEFTSANNFTAKGVKFDITQGTVNGITFNGNNGDISASENSLTIGNITYTVTAGNSGTVKSDKTVEGANITGTFNLTENGLKVGDITYSGTGSATISSSGVTIGNATYTGSGTVGSTVSDGVKVKIKSGNTTTAINGIIINPTSDLDVTATTGGVKIGDISYTGTGTVSWDGSNATTDNTGVVVKIGAGKSATFNGITYINSKTGELTAQHTANGTTFNSLTYNGLSGTVNTNGTVTGTMSISGANNTTINGYTVTGNIGISDGKITTLKQIAEIKNGSTYTYTATEDATVAVASDKVTVTSGKIKQTAGKLTVDGQEFTLDSSTNFVTWTGANTWEGTLSKDISEGATFTKDNKTYTALGDSAKLTAVGDASGGYVTLNGTFTTNETPATFTYNSNNYTPKSGTVVTYKLTGNGSNKIDSLTKEIYTVLGTRNATAKGETYTAKSGNKYTVKGSEATYQLEIKEGVQQTDNCKFISGTVSKTVTANTGKFYYKGTGDANYIEYTAQNNSTLKIDIAKDQAGLADAETFESVSGKATTSNTYLLKNGEVTIDEFVTYKPTNTGDVVKFEASYAGNTTTISSISGLSNGSALQAEIKNISKKISLSSITYSGGTKLNINSLDNVTVPASGGTFTATGDFSTAKTLNGKSLQVTGDSSVEVTLDDSGVTKISDVGANATVKSAAGATTIETSTNNGTFTIGSTKVMIADNAATDNKVTFTLDATGKITEISGFKRADDNYVTVTINDGTALKIRRDGDKISLNSNGALAEPDIGIKSYEVTYNGSTFSVTAKDKNDNPVKITSDDYTSDSAVLTLTGADFTKTPVTVKNDSETGIEVKGASADVAGIGEGTVFLDTNTPDTFKVGSFNANEFKVVGGTFTVITDEKTGISVEGNSTITAPADSLVKIKGNGTYTVNGTKIVTTGSTENKVEFTGSTVTGLSSAKGTFTLDKTNNALKFTINGTTVEVKNDNDNNGVTFTGVTGEDSKLTDISNISTDATVVLTETIPTSLQINGTAVVNSPAANTNIKYNTVDKKWTVGEAPAAENVTHYAIEVGAEGIVLKYSTDGTNYTQTKNVKDYEAVFGDDIVPKNSKGEAEDGGTLPTYSSSLPISTSLSQSVKLTVNQDVTVTASTVTELTLATPNRTYTVNNYAIKPSAEIEINATTMEIPLAADKTVEYNGMTFTGDDGASTATLTGNAAITLADKAKVTNTRNDTTFTITDTVKFDNFTFTNSSSTAVKYDNTAERTWTIGTAPLYISGDSDSAYSINISGKTISNINGSDVTISGDFAKGATITTTSSGKFTINGNVFTVKEDNDGVTFKTGADGKITEITSLSGSVEGDFTTAIKVNTKDVQVTGDDLIGVKGDGSGVTELYDLKAGITVNQLGDASKFITDGNGTYTFGTIKFVIENDPSVTFKSSIAGSITGVEYMGSDSKLVVNSALTSFGVDNDVITLTNASAENSVTLTVDGTGHVSTVEDIKAGTISSLTASDAVVKVKAANADITINSTVLNTSDADVTVKPVDNFKVEGIGAGTTITKAQNASLVTDDVNGAFNFPGHTFTIAQNTGDTLTFKTKNEESAVVEKIDGLNAGTITFSADAENNLLVGKNQISFTENAGLRLNMDNDTVKGVENLTGIIDGLPKDATVNVDDASVTINQVELEISSGGNDIVAYANQSGGTSGYYKVESIAGDATFTTAKNAELVTKSAGTFTFPSSHKFYTDDDSITFKTGDSNNVTEISGIDGNKKLTLYKDETNLKIDSDTFTVTDVKASDGVQLTLGADGHISKVDNVKGSVNGLVAGVDVQVKAANGISINNKLVTISDTADYTVRTADSGYGTITGVNQGSNITTANNASIVTNGARTNDTYTFGTTKYIVNGDATVTVGTGDTTNITSVGGLSSGTISGNFTDVINVDGKDIKITGDENVSVVADENSVVTAIRGINTVDAVTNITNAANVSLVTADQGAFVIGGNSYTISGDTDVTLVTDANSKVASIGGLDKDAKLIVSDDQVITINGKATTLKGITANPVTLTMGDNNTISTVDSLVAGYEIDGLPIDATVNVTGDNVTINGDELKIAEDSDEDFVVYANRDTGYYKVTDVEPNAVITTAKNASLVVSGHNDGTVDKYTFNNGTYSIAGDSDVTLVTDDYSTISAIGGLYGSLTSPEQYNFVNNQEIYSTNTDITIVAASERDFGVASLYGNGRYDTVRVSSGVYVSLKGYSDGNGNYNYTDTGKAATISAQINGTDYQLVGDADGIVIKDNVITGLDENAKLTINTVGSYVVNGSNLTLDELHKVVIGESAAKSARLYEEGEAVIADYTPADEIVDNILTDTITEEATKQISKEFTGDASNDETIKEIVDGTKGDVSIKTNSTGGSAVVIGSEATGTKTVDLKGDGDLVVVESTTATVEITTSGKGDSIVSSSNVTVKLKDDGTDDAIVMPLAGTATIKKYNSNSDAGIKVTNQDVAAAVRDNLITKSGNTVTLANRAKVIFGESGSDTSIVNFYNVSGELQKVGYTTSGVTKVDGTALTENIVLKGNYSDSLGGSNSSLLGGSGNDTVFAGDGNLIDAGYGNNYIELSNVMVQDASNATIGLTATEGTTTVKGFDVNDFADGEVVLIDTANADVSYSGSTVTFTKGNGSLVIENAGAKESGDGIAFVNVRIKDINSTDDPVKTSIAKSNSAIKAASPTNEDDFATAYVGGKNSGVDFSALTQTQTANINLGYGTGTVTVTNANDTIEITFRDIVSLKGGSTNHTLIGSATTSNTLEAGNGAGSIYGGGSSNDLLIAASYSTDKTAASHFIFGEGDGQDTLKNIQFYDSSKSDDENNKADIVEFSSGDTITGYTISDDNKGIVMAVNGTDSLTVENARGKSFYWSTTGGTKKIAKVDKDTITYDGFTNFYSVIGENATVKVESNTTTNVADNVFNLDNIKASIEGNIACLDASAITADNIQVVGSTSYGATLNAASGNNSTLWGNAGNYNDYLIGGIGKDIFYYGGRLSTAGKGEGNDTVTSFTADTDIIYLYDIKSTDVKNRMNAPTESGQVITLNMKNGNTLTINVTGDVNSAKFQFSNETTMTYDTLKASL